MTTEEFEVYYKTIKDRVEYNLIEKAKEYADHSDRLKNFNISGQVDGISREKALHGYMMKHFVSYKDMLSVIDNSGLPINKEIVLEKIGDLVTYFILQFACINERIDKNIFYVKGRATFESGYQL